MTAGCPERPSERVGQMKKRVRFTAFVMAFSMVLLFGGCQKGKTEREKPRIAAAEQTAGTAQPNPILNREVPEEFAGKTTVSLYRKLGANQPVYIKTMACEDNSCTLQSDYKAMMDYWNISHNAYVFIGWFFVDEEGNPAKWTGDGLIKVKDGGNTPIVAVFNTMNGKDEKVSSVLLYAKLGDAAPVRHFSTAYSGMYTVERDIDKLMKDWKLDKNRYAFEGWYYASVSGEPRFLTEDEQVQVEPGINLVLTAVFTDLVTGKTATIEDLRPPLATSP